MPLKDPEALRAYRQAYYARTRAEISAKKRAYYQAHRAKILDQRKAHAATHVEQIRTYRKAYKAARREALLQNMRDYWHANRVRLNAQKKAYRAAHPEETRARMQAWSARRSPEEKRAYNLAYYLANQEHLKAESKRYRLRHLAAVKDRMRRWRAANPDKLRAAGARRRARKASAPRNDLTAAQWREIQAAYDYRCVYCPPTCWRCQRKKHALTQDHIMPLAKGGSHTADNIVPACAACNQTKFTGPPPQPVQPLLITVAPAHAWRRKKEDTP